LPRDGQMLEPLEHERLAVDQRTQVRCGHIGHDVERLGGLLSHATDVTAAAGQRARSRGRISSLR